MGFSAPQRWSAAGCKQTQMHMTAPHLLEDDPIFMRLRLNIGWIWKQKLNKKTITWVGFGGEQAKLLF